MHDNASALPEFPLLSVRGDDDSDPAGFDLLRSVRRANQSARGHKDLPDLPTPDDLCKPYAQRCAEAYAEVLARQNWHWFVTLTFRPDHERASGGMHPEKADKAFRVLLSKINRECYGVRWYKRPDGGLMWARGQEFHKSGKIHFHAVVAAPNADLNTLTRRMRWVDFWWQEFGIARIEAPQSQEHVTAYVSKYVAKDGEVDFSPNYGRYVPPALDFASTATPTPTSNNRAPLAVAKRTGGKQSGPAAPALASRCLTPLLRQLLLLSRFAETETRHQLTTEESP